jgi:DNA-binding Xre family transcriptional regulator
MSEHLRELLVKRDAEIERLQFRVELIAKRDAEIDRLRARVEVLESALRIIARLDSPQVQMTPMRRACAALGIQP